MMAPSNAKMMANAIWMMNVHRTHHQNSPREARPLNVAYFFQKRMNASPVVGRLVERSGQCEEAAGPLWLRLRCAVLRLLLVVSGRIAVLRCAVLRRAILGCLLAVVGCAVLRCLLAVIILTVGAVTAILLGLLRVLRIILVGVRH